MLNREGRGFTAWNI